MKFNYGEPMEEYAKKAYDSGRYSRKEFRRQTFGFGTNPVSVFDSAEFIALLADAGNGAVNTSLFHGVGAATFTRATTAWTKLSSGLWTSVASGTARSFYTGLNTAVGAYAGFLAEGQRTNSCLQARDLSTTWTATTATLVKDQVGIDGVTNSASSLLSTAGNGQATQAIVLASAAKTFSVFIKRITGTGTVQISLDNFVTNTDVTASINSTTYTLVQMTQTLANPTVGIRLVTSGDKVAVDMAQLEDSASIASSPTPTTTVAVTRNLDVLTYPSSGNAIVGQGSIYCEIVVPFNGAAQAFVPMSLSDGTANNSCDTGNNGAGARFIVRSTGTQADIAVGVITANTAYKQASTWNTNYAQTCKDGALATADTTVTVPAAFTLINVGDRGFASTPLYGAIKNLRIWQRQLPDAQLQAFTT